MATGVRWLGLAAAGVVAVALLGLPPRTLGVRPSDPPGPEALARELDRELDRLDWTLRRMRVQDSLRAVLVDRPEAAADVAVGYPEAVASHPQVRQLEASVAAEEASLSERADGVLLGAYWVPRPQGSRILGARPPRRPGRTARSEWYGGMLPDGRSYCMAEIFVEPAPAHHEGAWPFLGLARPWEFQLGPCRLWGRFGPPGPAIERWLARGASGFTMGREHPRELAEQMAEVEPEVVSNHLRSREPSVWACLEGREDVCASLLSAEASVADERRAGSGRSGEASDRELERSGRPFGYLGRRGYTTLMGQPGQTLMAKLEREFGAAAVRAFWTSEAPVDVAFRQAFGVEPGAWTHRLLREFYPGAVRPHSTAPAAGDALATLVLVGLLARIAVGRSRGRQVR